MPRRKTPPTRAKVTGADVLHPSRHRGRDNATEPALGSASPWLTADQRAAWQAYRSELPWLRESDRCLVEIATVLRARLYAGGDVGVNALAQLRLCLSAMGATPVDLAKIATRDEDENDDDPAGAYFQ